MVYGRARLEWERNAGAVRTVRPNGRGWFITNHPL